MLVSSFAFGYGGDMGAGTDPLIDGSAGHPYLIQDLADFSAFCGNSSYWDDYTRLDCDLSIGTYAQAPIAGSANFSFDGVAFTGCFNGNNHVISNLTVNGSYYSGLFGKCLAGAEIINLGLENFLCKGHTFVGGLVGANYDGNIKNCYSTGHIGGPTNDGLIDIDAIGGLVGYNNGGTISNCYSAGTITCPLRSMVNDNEHVGGLVGYNYDSTIINSYSTMNVTASLWGGVNVGGLVGFNQYGNIYSSYSTGSIIGDNFVGGLVGQNVNGSITSCYSTGSATGLAETHGGINTADYIGGLVGVNHGSITSSYSTGQVSGDNYVGGLVGDNDAGVISSFWDKQTSGRQSSNGGTGKTTLEMQNPDTFISVGWDFDTPIWMITGQDYPRLIWNIPDIDNSGKVDFADFARLALNWLSLDCDMCDRTDLTGDRNVNGDDLTVFAGSWLDVDNITDHVFKISAESYLEHYQWNVNPDDIVYGFEIRLMTDATVDRVEFLAPNGNVFEITSPLVTFTPVTDGWIETGRRYDSETGNYEWGYQADFNNAAPLSDYGDGNYMVTVHYLNGRSQNTTVWFGVPGTTDAIAQPTQEPNLTSFANGDALLSPVPFTWDGCTDPAASIVWFGLENLDTGEEFEEILPVSATAPAGPQTLILGAWEVGIGFEVWYTGQNGDGVDFEVGKYSESDYNFTVAP